MNANLLLIFVCLALGPLLKRTGKFPAATPQVLNHFVLWVAYPALVLIQIPDLLRQMSWTWAIAIPVSMAWIQFALGILVFHYGAKYFRFSKPVAGALVLTAGFGNTSFVGFPLLEAFLGPEAVRIGILCDQPGSFIAISTVGILYATAHSPRGGRALSARAIAKRVICFPPFAALLFAVLWWTAGAHWPAGVHGLLEKLASLLVPLALLAVGFQLRLSPALLKKQWRPLTAGLVFKLVLAPSFFTLLYVGVLGSHSFLTKVTLLESAMAPMITSAIVAEELGFDADTASLMLGIGIPLSLLTVWLWSLVWTF